MEEIEKGGLKTRKAKKMMALVCFHSLVFG